MGMNADLEFTVGDRLVPLRFQLLDADGKAIDLTGAVVTLKMVRDLDGTVKIPGGLCTVEEPLTAGRGYYVWAGPDVDTAGLFWVYIVRTKEGVSATLPVGREFSVLFEEAL
jgi:hypothetical protein